MAAFPWFPFGFKLSGGVVGRLLKEGLGYQIVENQGRETVFLRCDGSALVAAGVRQILDPDRDGVCETAFGQRSYLYVMFSKNEQPIVVRDWSVVMGLPTSSDVADLGKALRTLRQEF